MKKVLIRLLSVMLSISSMLMLAACSLIENDNPVDKLEGSIVLGSVGISQTQAE